MLRKCTIFMGKKSLCISQGMKKTLLINRFFRIFENYAPLIICIFFRVMQIMRSEPNYASEHNSGSPVLCKATFLQESLCRVTSKKILRFAHAKYHYSRTVVLNHLPKATAHIQNTKLFPVKVLQLEPLVNYHLL